MSDINITIEDTPIDVNISVNQGVEVTNVDVDSTQAPVQSVNGYVGYVTLNKSDIGLSNVENVSILGASGYLQTQINNLDSGYATDAELRLVSGILYTGLQNTGSYLNTKIDNLSGVVVLKYGDQSITGIKTFVDKTYVSGLKFQVLGTGAAPTPAYEQGLVFYDNTNHTLNLYVDNPEVTLQVGQENWVRVKNQLGATINNGNLVYIAGGIGANPYVQLAIANSDTTSASTLGMATHNISTNEFGYITTFGIVNDVDTDGYSVGDTLYLSPTTSGQYTNVKPQAPQHLVSIGTVIRANKNNGVIFVNISNGYELEELHDVRINNKQNGQFLIYNSGSGVWYNTQSFPVRPYVNGTPILLSGEVAPADLSSTVQLTGDQNISGIKNFYSRPTVNGTGIMLSGEAAQLPTTIVYTTGNQNISGTKNFYLTPTVNGVNVLTGVDLSAYATNISLQSTGSNLDNKINSLSGVAVLTYGNQTINGNKTFNDNVYIQNLTVTGTQTIVNTTNTNVGSNYVLLNATGGARDAGIFIVTGSGMTGVNDVGAIIGYDVPANQWVFGNTSRNSDLSTLAKIASTADISNYSGYVNNTYATIINLASTGSTLSSTINSLSGSLTGNYFTIGGDSKGSDLTLGTNDSYNLNLETSGATRVTVTNMGYVGIGTPSPSRMLYVSGSVTNIATFQSSTSAAPAITIQGTDRSVNLSPSANGGNGLGLTGPSFYRSEYNSSNNSVRFSATNINQTVSYFQLWDDGIANTLALRAGTAAQQFRVYNVTGTNSGEFGLFGWDGSNNLIIGTQATSSGISRDIIITGNNITLSGGMFNVTTNPSIGTTRIYSSNNGLVIQPGIGGSRQWTLGNSVFYNNGGFSIGQTAQGLTLNANTLVITNGNNLTDQYNGTNPQTLRIFNATGTNSGEFGIFGWQSTGSGAGNALVVGTQATQSGIVRDTIVTGSNISLRTNGEVYIGDGSLKVGKSSSGGTNIVANNVLSLQGSNLYGNVCIGPNGASQFAIPLYGYPQVRSDGYYSWSSSAGNASMTPDLYLYRDASGILAQRNNLGPQQFRVYNITGTNTGEFGLLGWQNNQFIVGAQATNSGTLRSTIITGNNIILNPSGKVGILNNNPQYQIDVSGTGKFTSEIVTTQNFTSGASGNIAVYQYYNTSTQSLDTVFN